MTQINQKNHETRKKENRNLIPASNSQVFPHFNKTAQALLDGKINLGDIKDCKDRKHILKIISGCFTECLRPKSFDSKCSFCEFNYSNQKKLILKRDDRYERKQDRIFR